MLRTSLNRDGARSRLYNDHVGPYVDIYNQIIISGEGNDSLISLLQPCLMNSLPLTSYALLLDMINRQSLSSATNASLLSHINQVGNIDDMIGFPWEIAMW